MLVLPPVEIARTQRLGSSGGGRMRTRRQSASSSSARIIGSAVLVPCPISASSTITETLPSVATRTQAAGCSPGGAAPAAVPGR